MEKEFLTKEEAKNKYLTKRSHDLEKLNPEAFLLKYDAEEKYLTKKEFYKVLEMKDYLPKYKFNRFMVWVGIVIFLIWLLSF
jgi:hypothetical protein